MSLVTTCHYHLRPSRYIVYGPLYLISASGFLSEYLI
jgi:hypothetical protein